MWNKPKITIWLQHSYSYHILATESTPLHQQTLVWCHYLSLDIPKIRVIVIIDPSHANEETTSHIHWYCSGSNKIWRQGKDKNWGRYMTSCIQIIWETGVRFRSIFTETRIVFASQRFHFFKEWWSSLDDIYLFSDWSWRTLGVVAASTWWPKKHQRDGERAASTPCW